MHQVFGRCYIGLVGVEAAADGGNFVRCQIVMPLGTLASEGGSGSPAFEIGFGRPSGSLPPTRRMFRPRSDESFSPGTLANGNSADYGCSCFGRKPSSNTQNMSRLMHPAAPHPIAAA